MGLLDCLCRPLLWISAFICLTSAGLSSNDFTNGLTWAKSPKQLSSRALSLALAALQSIASNLVKLSDNFLAKLRLQLVHDKGLLPNGISLS